MAHEVLRLGEHRAVHLIEVLGSGGFGVVWRGELRGGSGLVKSVAVKVLTADAAEVAELASRLRDEARMLGLLQHRAIVGVDDLVEVDGRWALVMEYVDGVDLQRLIERGPLPQRPVCELLVEAASALRAAHEARHPSTGEPLELVHRDIKPANLRITPSGDLKLLDFGIARARFDAREATTRDLSFGSIGYMAPERWEGREEPASDVYALGIVGIEALQGAPLGQLPVEPVRHAARLAEALDALPDLPTALRAVLASMVAYEAADRPTATEVARRLRALLTLTDGPWLAEWVPDAIASIPSGDAATRPQPPRTPTLAEPAAVPSLPRRRRWVALWAGAGMATALALAVGAAGLGGVAWMLLGAPDATSTPQPAGPSSSESDAEPAPAELAPPPVTETPPEPIAPVVAEPAPTPLPAPIAAPVSPAPLPAPTPTVAPAPAPEPAPALRGEVVLHGVDVAGVSLIDPAGRSRSPGPVPVGRYDARVRFADGVTITVRDIEVRAGETTTLRCSAAVQTCVVR